MAKDTKELEHLVGTLQRLKAEIDALAKKAYDLECGSFLIPHLASAIGSLEFAFQEAERALQKGEATWLRK